ncbi:MAG: thiamine biosynthesis protein ThiC [Litorimonas sp.]
MELTHNRTVKIVATLLFLAAISQPIYTALYTLVPEFGSRKALWGLEAILFVLLTAFAGSALVMAKRYTLGFSAIAFSAILNVMQIGVGLTQFGPFRAASSVNPELGGMAFSVVAFSFFGYNAAKILLALAAIVFGMGKIGEGKKILGGAAVAVGIVAFIANALVMTFGLQGFVPRPLAGGSGVLATLLLSLCLFTVKTEQ